MFDGSDFGKESTEVALDSNSSGPGVSLRFSPLCVTLCPPYLYVLLVISVVPRL